MHLAPNAAFGRSHSFDASGVVFRRGENGFEVEIVLTEMAAARAGLQRGDRLLTIDATAANRLTPNELRDGVSSRSLGRTL